MSRGLRNNNPGNIRRTTVRYKGEVPSSDREFKAFCAPEWGYRAMFVLLHTYRVKHRLDTIRKMIGRYAPSSENDTPAYVKFVASRSKLPTDEPIDTLLREQMIPLVSAMSRIENGMEADIADISAGWGLFLAERV